MKLRLESIERLHIGLLALTVGFAALTGWLAPASVALGGVVMAVNFWVMRQLFRHVALWGTGRRGGVVVALAVMKFGLFLALLALLFRRLPLHALSFAAGATVLLTACVVETLRCEAALS